MERPIGQHYSQGGKKVGGDDSGPHQHILQLYDHADSSISRCRGSSGGRPGLRDGFIRRPSDSGEGPHLHIIIDKLYDVITDLH